MTVDLNGLPPRFVQLCTLSTRSTGHRFRTVPSGATYRYSVADDTPMASQISSTESSGSFIRREASLIFPLSMERGRPPFRPRALADASPAIVRSRTRSRSNSARAPKIWKMSLPVGLVAKDRLLERAEAYLPLAERLALCDQILETAAEAVESPDDQDVSGPRVAQGFLQARTFTLRAGELIGEYAITASPTKGIELEIELLICCGDTGVANEHVQSEQLFPKSYLRSKIRSLYIKKGIEKQNSRKNPLPGVGGGFSQKLPSGSKAMPLG